MKKKLWIDYIPAAATAVLIIFFAVWRQQSPVKTLPTLITLAVQVLNAHADRRAFLLGAANSLLYGLAYYMEGIYFSMISAVLISAPMQIYSYFNWRRHSHGSRPALKMLGRQRVLLVIGLTLAGWGICCLMPFFRSGSFPAVDALSFAVGITVTLLVARRYVDSQFFGMANSIIGLTLWILLAVRDPANLNYVVISAYNLFRVVEAAFNWVRATKGEKI
ncbi:MAG: nicotinamide mononucleotide transporter [Clostridia bacterium]|nr:nicotinamide mononucleotide transporter [Clostridia bacterium]